MCPGLLKPSGMVHKGVMVPALSFGCTPCKWPLDDTGSTSKFTTHPPEGAGSVIRGITAAVLSWELWGLSVGIVGQTESGKLGKTSKESPWQPLALAVKVTGEPLVQSGQGL